MPTAKRSGRGIEFCRTRVRWPGVSAQAGAEDVELPTSLAPVLFGGSPVTNMTRLILTADSSGAGSLTAAGRADLVVAIEPRLVWGPPLSDAELAAFLATRTTQKP